MILCVFARYRLHLLLKLAVFVTPSHCSALAYRIAGVPLQLALFSLVAMTSLRFCVKLTLPLFVYSQGYSREIVSAIQSLRKASKLVNSDKVEVLFQGETAV